MNYKYGNIDPDMLKFYNTLDIRRKMYVDYRVQGMSKSEAYRLAYKLKKCTSQAAYALEKREPRLVELIESIENRKKTDVTNPESDLSLAIDALSNSPNTKKAQEIVSKATGEEAERLLFYKNILQGKTTTTKKTLTKDASGKVTAIKEEIIEATITEKMNARKQLDIILGLQNGAAAIGTIQAGEITINIVDATNKEKKEDTRNIVNVEEIEVVENDARA